MYGRTTLAISGLIAVTIIVLESYVASLFLKTFGSFEGSPARGVPVYLMIFLFSQIFQFILCWDAVSRSGVHGWIVGRWWLDGG